MRILRLRVDGRRELDLHPNLSVVTGLDPGQAATVRRAVAGVAGGLAPRAGGLLEAAGLLLDATQRDLDLLDLGAEPAPGVLVAPALGAAVPGAGDLIERLAAAERDAARLATERRWAARARDQARSVDWPGARDLARAEALRLEVAVHEATDVEPLRRALDAHRDAALAGTGTTGTAAARRTSGPGGARSAEDPAPPVAGLVDALADLGVDLHGRRLTGAEVRRIAEDLLDEHVRHAAWVAGARVELAGLDRRVRARVDPEGASAPGRDALLPESGERRAERAAAAQADAIARADELRAQLVDVAPPPPTGLSDALVARITDRRRDPPAGSAPVVVDRVLAGLQGAQVERLLERIEPLSRSVQLLVLDEHPAAVAWAHAAGATRAAVVSPLASPAPTPLAGAPPTMRPT